MKKCNPVTICNPISLLKKQKGWTRWEWLIHCLTYEDPFWSINHFVKCHILHTHDYYGMKFDKPIRFGYIRYTIGINTYYKRLKWKQRNSILQRHYG